MFASMLVARDIPLKACRPDMRGIFHASVPIRMKQPVNPFIYTLVFAKGKLTLHAEGLHSGVTWSPC